MSAWPTPRVVMAYERALFEPTSARTFLGLRAEVERRAAAGDARAEAAL